jgi:hypothetical protein
MTPRNAETMDEKDWLILGLAYALCRSEDHKLRTHRAFIDAAVWIMKNLDMADMSTDSIVDKTAAKYKDAKTMTVEEIYEALGVQKPPTKSEIIKELLPEGTEILEVGLAPRPDAEDLKGYPAPKET